MTREEMYERKNDFVWDYLDPCLNAAKSHLSCAYYFGSEIELKPSEKYHFILPESEYVVVTCENGYRYFIDVSGNSLCSIAEETFRAMACK